MKHLGTENDPRDIANLSDTVRRAAFSDGALLELQNGQWEYRASGTISTLGVIYPHGYFEVWMKFTLGAAPDIIFPEETSYIGSAPEFAEGETWEISIKDGVMVACRVDQTQTPSVGEPPLESGEVSS